MKKQILILMLVILFIGNVMAVDKIKPQPLPTKNFGLNTDKIEVLANKGISNIDIIEYPCQDNYKCFAVQGDINSTLIKIPSQVKDNCIQDVRIVNKTRVLSNGKIVLIPTTLRTCTGVYNYRDITQEEIDYITNNALNKLLENQIPKEQDPYYPIQENTQTKSKSISLGKSIGEWTNKVIDYFKEII